MAAAAPVLRPMLWYAARRGWTVDVRRFLGEEADIKERGGPNQTSPLREATYHGHEKVVRMLLDHGADALGKDHLGLTPLFFPAQFGLLGILLLLLENGAEVDAKNNNGMTPLCFAAYGGHEAVVMLLLEHGAAVSSKTHRVGFTPLHNAALCGHYVVVQVLLHRGLTCSRRHSSMERLLWTSRSNTTTMRSR